MNVIKVIVDEMPKSCKECKFEAVTLGNNPYCDLSMSTLDNDRNRTRHDWCPLVTVGEYATEVVREYLKMVEESEVE